MPWLPMVIFDPRRSNIGLFSAYAFVGLSVGLVFVWAFLHWVFQKNTDFMVYDGLFGQAEEVADAVSVSADGRFSISIHEPMNWAYDAFFSNLKFRVLSSDGKVLISSDGTNLPLLPEGTLNIEDVPEFFRLPMPGGGSIAVGTFHFEKSGYPLIVQTARSDRFSELAAEAIYPAVFETAVVLAVGILLIIFLAALLALRKSTQRIRRYCLLADRIEPDSLNERLCLSGVPVEIAPLVEAFNRALDRIEVAYRVQQRFVANAAHELKTPLSIIRAQVDLNITSLHRQRLLADIDAMTRNVQQMLHLSQVQDLGNYRFADVSLNRVVEDVVAAFQGFPGLVGKSLELVSEERGRVRGDEAILFTAVRNLVENAIRHSPEGGVVVIGVRAREVWVRDYGPGFDPNTRHLLFERFWRADSSQTGGSGLGLSIVAEIARAHGGKVTAELPLEGAGSIFRLEL